jgi:hypothetical protein
MKRVFIAGSALVLMMAAGLPRTAQAEADLGCKMKFSLTGWSLIYKRAEGSGVVTCADGTSIPVTISAKGGGLTVGKSHIDNGTGKFTEVHKIEDVLGTYAQGDASIGAVKSGTAQILTKGTVSLALAGAGEGVDIGVSFGGFTIERAAETHHKKK